MRNKSILTPVQYYAGFSRKFQGIGISISFQNPTITRYEANVIFTFILLWFRLWVMYRKELKR